MALIQECIPGVTLEKKLKPPTLRSDFAPVEGASREQLKTALNRCCLSEGSLRG